MSTLVTMADNGNMQLVCVVLKTHGVNVYPDTRNLLEYGFANFSKVLPAAYEESEDVAKIPDEQNIVVPNGVEFQDLEMEIVPDEESEEEGTLAYSYKGSPVGSVRAVLSQAYFDKAKAKEEDAKKSQEKQKGGSREAKSGKDKKAGILENKTILKKCVLGAAGVIFVVLVSILVKLLLDGKRKKKRKR